MSRAYLVLVVVLVFLAWFAWLWLRRSPGRGRPLEGMDVYEEGYDLMKGRDYREAVKVLERYLSEAADDWVALFDLGRCYAHLGDWEVALRYFNRALEIDPQSVEARSEAASILAEHLEDFKEAEAHLAAIEERLRSDDNLWEAARKIFYFERAWVCLKKGDTTAALDYFNQSAGAYFSDSQWEDTNEIFSGIHYRMGVFYKIENNNAEAATSFQKAIASGGPQCIFAQQAQREMEEVLEVLGDRQDFECDFFPGTMKRSFLRKENMGVEKVGGKK